MLVIKRTMRLKKLCSEMAAKFGKTSLRILWQWLHRSYVDPVMRDMNYTAQHTTEVTGEVKSNYTSRFQGWERFAK